MSHLLLGALCSGAVEPVHHYKYVPFPIWLTGDNYDSNRRSIRSEKRRAGMKKKQIAKRRARNKNK